MPPSLRTPATSKRLPNHRARRLSVLLGSLTALGLVLAAACSGGKLSPEERRVKSDLEALRDAISHYMASNLGHTPESLEALLSRGGEGSGFLSADEIPKDPWNRPYVYLPPLEDRPYNILCLGRDGIEGGNGDDADIDLNMIREQRI